MRTAFTPFAFLIRGMIFPGICFSVTIKSRGSSESSKSSTIAWRMLILFFAMMVATSATIPGMLGSVGMISMTPQFMVGAISFKWQVGVSFEKIFVSSGVVLMVSMVAVIARRSMLRARAIFESESSMSPQ